MIECCCCLCSVDLIEEHLCWDSAPLSDLPQTYVQRLSLRWWWVRVADKVVYSHPLLHSHCLLLADALVLLIESCRHRSQFDRHSLLSCLLSLVLFLDHLFRLLSRDAAYQLQQVDLTFLIQRQHPHPFLYHPCHNLVVLAEDSLHDDAPQMFDLPGSGVKGRTTHDPSWNPTAAARQTADAPWHL